MKIALQFTSLDHDQGKKKHKKMKAWSGKPGWAKMGSMGKREHM